MRNLLSTLIGISVFVIGIQVASAWNYVIHVQGRSQQTWKHDSTGQRMVLASLPSGWSNVTLTMNGNARITSTETDGSGVNSVNGAIRTYCGTGTGHSCIIHCYSAGCLRVNKAIDNIRNGVGGGANTLSGLLYIEASAGAHGGTDLAELSTSGFTGFLAKLLGQQEAVDKDLTRSAARTTYSYVHDQTGVNMWHLAGHYDVCKKLFLGFKICGSSRIAGTDDGVVPWASSGGYNSSSARTSMCSVSSTDERDTSKHVSSKYYWHRTDTYYETCAGNSVADGASWDHFGMPDAAEAAIEADVGGSGLYAHWQWSDATTQTACSYADCDRGFANSNNNDFGTRYADGYATGATGVDSVTSQTYGQTGSTTSCAGRCGTAPGGSYCACTSAASVKCGDYYTVNCDDVNQ